VSTFELKMTSYGGEARPRVGFFTDTSLCIGCKACEVACKTWNDVPEDGLDFTGMSLDNTKTLDADTWRHVAFVEQRAQLYLADEDNGIGGAGAFFLLLDDPEVYGLPPDPVDTSRHLGQSWRAAGAAAVAMLGAVAGAVAWGSRR